MSVTVSPRLGVYQWSASTDEFSREQLNDSFADLETRLQGYIQGTTRPPASSRLRGFIFFHSDAHVFSYCDGVQWWDIIGGENFGSVSSLLLTSITTEGTSTLAPRSDHVHGMPGFGTPVSVGLSLSSGTGNQPARANHIHDIGSNAVTSASLTNNSVDENVLANSSITPAKIQSSAITEAKLDDLAVATANVANLAVTEGKLANGAAAGAKVGSVDASKFTSGIFDIARIPNLPASKFGTGTFNPSVLPAKVPSDPADYPIQPGQILIYAGTSAPAGYLLCDGSAVSRTTYANLHSVISAAGYPYGSGDGSTTFNVPNLTGSKIPLGKTASGTGSILGESGGSLGHTHAGPSHTHDANPANVTSTSAGSHTHTNPSTGSAGSHSHTIPTTAGATNSGIVANDGTSGGVSKDDIDHSHSHSHSSGSYSTTSGGPHSHSHDVTGTSSTSTPSYSVSASHQHDHTTPSTSSQSSHSHTTPNTNSKSSHLHDVNIANFTSSSIGAGTTGTADPPYLGFKAIIKT